MSWPKVSLNELGYVSRGRSKHRPRNDASLFGGSYPFIQTADIKRANLRVEQHFETYNEKGLEQSRIWPKDTLCTTIAANIADTAILAYEACFPDSIIGFIADPKKANPFFVKYFFDTIQRELRMVSQGAAQDNINQEKLLSFGISCPPLEVQNAIASTLCAYDDLIATNQRRIALLEEAARRIYREWFVQLRFPGHEAVPVVDGVPQGWRKSSIAEQSSFLNRGITPKYDDTAAGLVINQKCIRDGKVSMEPARRQAKEVKPERMIQLGDVLINSTGAGTLGRVAQVRTAIENCTVDTHITIARPNSAEAFIYFGLALLDFEPIFSEMGKGSTNQLELARADIGACTLWQPPQALCIELHRLVWPMLQQVEDLLATNRKLQNARDLLLPKLMSGQLDVSRVVVPAL